MKLPKKQPNKLLRVVWILLALLVVVVGAYLYYQSTKGQPTPRAVEQNQVAEDTDKDKASKFPQLSQTPVRIMIDKIDVDAPIEPVGLTDDGLMAAPDTNELVGWYEQSARAGEDRYAMLLDGHYGSDTVPAVFRDLIKLELGDSIKVQGEDGAILKYKVVETDRHYAEDVDMKKALNPYRPGAQSLTIITCEGQYDPVNVTYDKRTIVYAERVE